MNHTLGPWKVRFIRNGDSVHAPDGRPICFAPSAAYIPNYTQGREEVQANFRILAAAPALYAALEVAIEAIANSDTEFCAKAIQQARAALAKARGE
jgi:hypothetical protein